MNVGTCVGTVSAHWIWGTPGICVQIWGTPLVEGVGISWQLGRCGKPCLVAVRRIANANRIRSARMRNILEIHRRKLNKANLPLLFPHFSHEQVLKRNQRKSRLGVLASASQSTGLKRSTQLLKSKGDIPGLETVFHIIRQSGSKVCQEAALWQQTAVGHPRRDASSDQRLSTKGSLASNELTYRIQPEATESFSL